MGGDTERKRQRERYTGKRCRERDIVKETQGNRGNEAKERQKGKHWRIDGEKETEERDSGKETTKGKRQSGKTKDQR